MNDDLTRDPSPPVTTETAEATDHTASVPTGTLYELRGVERRYVRGSTPVLALHDVDLDIELGEFLSLEGPSGSGKSTLLQLLGALDTPTSGTIRFEGDEMSSASDATLTRIRAREIGFVFQQFNLVPTLTAEENVGIAMIPHGHSRFERKERARQSSSTELGSEGEWTICRRGCRVVSNSESPSLAPSRTGPG